MTKYNASELAALFRSGGNLMAWLRAQEQAGTNTPTTILYAYDVQSGTYTDQARQPAVAAMKAAVGRRLADVLARFAPGTLLDAGCGEATTLVPILDALGPRAPREVLAFDLSLSRLLFAQRNLAGRGARLCTAELDRIPLPDASVDVAITVHALEPNRGKEEAIIAELLRVARRGVVMVEPSRELASPEAGARMERLGYVADLPGAIRRLGHHAETEPFGIDANPANPAALIVVTKDGAGQPVEASAAAPDWISPISRTPLQRRADCLFSPIDGHAFPVIQGIACLTQEAAILASKLGDF